MAEVSSLQKQTSLCRGKGDPVRDLLFDLLQLALFSFDVVFQRRHQVLLHKQQVCHLACRCHRTDKHTDAWKDQLNSMLHLTSSKKTRISTDRWMYRSHRGQSNRGEESWSAICTICSESPSTHINIHKSHRVL